MKHAIKQRGLPKTPAEAVTELRKVVGQMFLAHAMMDAADIPFHFGDQGMHPGEQLYGLRTRSRYHPDMTAGQVIQDSVSLAAVGVQHHLAGQTFLHQGLDFRGAHPGHHPHGGKRGLVTRGFHGHHFLGLAGAAAASLAGFWGPEVGVVHLQKACQLVESVPIAHGLADFVAHAPHGFIAGDVQHPLQRQHIDAAFLASHQPDLPKPLVQRSPGLVKHRAGRQRSLIATSLTMIKVACPMELGISMVAAGTPEALQPPQVKQLLSTGFFSAEPLLKLHQAKGLLLHRLRSICLII
jgi:hypothetical protein